MNLFNGFGFGGFGRHGDKGCGCDDDNGIWGILLIIWLLSCCGCNIDFDICEILPLIILLALLSSCFCGDGHNNCPKGPY